MGRRDGMGVLPGAIPSPERSAGSTTRVGRAAAIGRAALGALLTACVVLAAAPGNTTASTTSTADIQAIYLPAVVRHDTPHSVPGATATSMPPVSPTPPPTPPPDRGLTRLSQVGGTGLSIAAADGMVYVGHGPRVVAYRVTGGSGLERLGETVPFGGVVIGLAVAGRYVYAAATSQGVWAIDVTDPARPAAVGHSPPRDGSVAVVVRDRFAYVAEGDTGLRVLDATSPEQPLLIAEPPLTYAGWQIHDLGNGFAYVDDDPLALADLRDPSRPRLTRLDRDAWPWGDIWDVDGASVVAESAVSRPDVVLLDATDPLRPRELSRIDTPYYPWLARLVDGRLYVNSASGLSLLQVFDVTVPERPALLGEVHIGWVAADMVVRDNRAYLALEPRTGEGGVDESPGRLLILDVSNPGRIAVLGELQFAHGAVGLAVVGGYGGGPGSVCVLTRDLLRTGGSGLYIVDVSDPARPTIMAFEPTRGPATGVVVHGDRVVVSVQDVGDRFRWPLIVRKASGHGMVFDVRRPDYPELDQIGAEGNRTRVCPEPRPSARWQPLYARVKRRDHRRRFTERQPQRGAGARIAVSRPSRALAGALPPAVPGSADDGRGAGCPDPPRPRWR